MIRRAVRWVVLSGVLIAAILVCIVFGVRYSIRDDQRDLGSVEPAPVAIVLGAGLRPDGTPGQFLRARLELAKTLFDSGKVEALLITGDNGEVNYNEVGAMRTWLVDHGVPDSRIVSDYAGFDTHDSCVRAQKIFGVEEAIVVTQGFHLPRALFSCGAAGIEVQGVAAATGSAGTGFNELREWPATLKAAYDAALGRDPKYLGGRETGVDDILKSVPR